MCRVRLICRFPPRESRCRTWSPDEASIGAVPVQDAKLVAVGEPGDVADLDQESGSALGADAVQVEQPGAGLAYELGELLVGCLLAGIDPLEVTDQLGRDPSASLAGHVTWSDGGEQLLGLSCGQVLLRPTRD